MDDVEPSVGHEPAQAQRPARVAAPRRQAHRRDARRLQLAGEVILPGQDVGHRRLETIRVARPRHLDEETLGAARARPLVSHSTLVAIERRR